MQHCDHKHIGLHHLDTGPLSASRDGHEHDRSQNPVVSLDVWSHTHRSHFSGMLRRSLAIGQEYILFHSGWCSNGSLPGNRHQSVVDNSMLREFPAQSASQFLLPKFKKKSDQYKNKFPN